MRSLSSAEAERTCGQDDRPTEHRRSYKQELLSQIADYSVVFTGLGGTPRSSDGWTTAQCPFHDDAHPSFSFHRETGRWRCFAGCGEGNAIDFLMKRSGKGFQEALAELGDLAGIAPPAMDKPMRPPIKESLVDQCTRALNENIRARHWLREERGLTDETIRRYEIGWDTDRRRYTIPIRDERGNVVNIRLYSPRHTPKMINYVDGNHRYGSPPRLYGVDGLAQQCGGQVVLCEGEWDRLLLCQEGFIAVTGTHGAGTFRPEWLQYFSDKEVVVLYDCDGPGQAAVTNTILPALKTAGAASIKNVVLPLRGTPDDKDPTHYLVGRGLSVEGLRRLVDETPRHSYKQAEQSPEQGEETIELPSFTEIERTDLVDKKVACEITVCGETSEAFHAAKAFRVASCRRMQQGKCFECTADPVVLPEGSQELIGSCMSTNVQLVAALREYVCKHGQKPTIEVTARTTVTEFFCHQRVRRIHETRDERNDTTAESSDIVGQELVEKRVYYLSSDRPRPGSYRAIGWVKSHPKTQQVTFLIDSLEPLEEDFECFSIGENAEHLRSFGALSTDELITDLAENVTHIYQRDEILTATLLTYCSPRWLPFNGETIRGWLVTLVLGDAGTGKTQTVQRIAEFAGVGDCFSGLTGSRTGLAYALVEHKQKGWQVRIGRYPANSRRILIVDEAQHLPEFDLRVLAKSMEEGFIQIDRVQSRGYESQTRLILIANPKRDAVMDSFSFGCEALATILPPTIIRRADIAVFANSGDLTDLSVINRRPAEHRVRKITPEMLRAVFFWGWNLRPEQIQFTSDAEQECLRSAEQLSDVYGYAAELPLITTSDCRNNLARLAAAFAVLRVSATGDFTRLRIDSEHARMAVEFLSRVYSHENCALDDYSQIARASSQLLDYGEIEAAFLRKLQRGKYAGDDVRYFARLISILRTVQVIRRDDLAEQAGCSTDTVKRTIRLLKGFNLIESTRDGYAKKPKFNKFLRRFIGVHPEFFEEDREGAGSKALEHEDLDAFWTETCTS